MKTKIIIMAFTALTTLIGFSAKAEARSADGMVTETTKMRAGPGRDYPVIGMAHPHVLVEVRGCISNWNWCDVVVDHKRGWIRRDNLRVRYHNRAAQVMYAGPLLGLPVFAFDLEDYWDTHYYGQSFYVEYFRHHPHHHHRDRGHDWHNDRDHDNDHDHDHDHDSDRTSHGTDSSGSSGHHDDSGSSWHHHD